MRARAVSIEVRCVQAIESGGVAGIDGSQETTDQKENGQKKYAGILAVDLSASRQAI